MSGQSWISHAVPWAVEHISAVGAGGVVDISQPGADTGASLWFGAQENGAVIERYFDETGSMLYSWRLRIPSGTQLARATIGEAGGADTSRQWPFAVLLNPSVFSTVAVARLGTWAIETDMRMVDPGVPLPTTRRIIGGLVVGGARHPLTGLGGDRGLIGLVYCSDLGSNWHLAWLIGVSNDPATAFGVVFAEDTGVSAFSNVFKACRVELGPNASGELSLRAKIDGAVVAEVKGPMDLTGVSNSMVRNSIHGWGRGVYLSKDATASDSQTAELYAGAVMGIRSGWIAPSV